MNKLPVYLFENGKIINPILAINNKFILDIGLNIVKLFGLDIRIITNIEEDYIKYIINDIDDKVYFLLKYMIKERILLLNNYILEENIIYWKKFKKNF